MKKKLFSILLSLAMVVTMMPMATMTAFATEYNTVADILNSVAGGFPTTGDGDYVPPNAWKATDNLSCYIVNDYDGTYELCFRDSEGYVPIDLDGATVEHVGEAYVHNFDEGKKVTFNMNGDTLTSIVFDNQTYTPPVTIADILAKAEGGFPTGTDENPPAGAWVNENGKAWLYNLNNTFIWFCDNGGVHYGIDLKKPVTQNEGNYVYTQIVQYEEEETSQIISCTDTVTFNMNNGELVSVIFETYNPENDSFNGTYASVPAPSNWEILTEAFSGEGDYSSEEIIKDGETNLFKAKDTTDGSVTTRTITLLSDITAISADSALVVSSDAKIVLDLNGHTIDRNLNEATANGFVVNVEGNLTIKDIATGGGKITGGNNKCVYSKPYGGGVRVASGGALTMTGGEITGNFSVKADGDGGFGGGVYVNKNGSFNMSGGKITDNMAESQGGGVYIVDNATFNMTGGEISGNSSTNGTGGIFSSGNCTMSGNSIISHNSGTGVSANNGTFKMSGNSIISYNSSTNADAGGLIVGSNCEFTMSDNSKISYNSSGTAPGGVYNLGTFKMIGGSIDHNTANNFGGICTIKNITLGGTAKIKDNVKGGEIIGGELSGGAPNNVYLPSNKYITIADGTDAPKTGMMVGVTTQTAPTEGTVKLTTNGTANHLQYFFSDSADYYVGFNSSSNYLELKKPVAGNHIITVTPSEHGSVTPSPSDASAGTTVTLTVTPASGYELSANSLKVTSADGTVIPVTGTGNTYTFTMPNSAVTVSALFIQAEEKYSVPVEGDSSVKVEATIENKKAKVSEITKNDLEEFVENTESKTNVDSLELDFTEAKQDVMGVEFTKPTLENVQDVLESNQNNINNLVVKMSEGTVSLDAKALEAVTEQANGDTIILVVDKTQDNQLTTAKQETLKDYNVNKTFEAYFESNGQRIHDFKGGVATVSMKFEPTQGSNTDNYKIYYLDDNAKMHKYATKYKDGMLVFATTHFSDYVIVYDGKVDVLLAQAKLSKDKIKLSWNGLDNITKYVVYGAKCGHNYKKLKTTTGKSYTVKKASGKKLKAHKTYKFYVVAYDAVGNKVQSRSIHYIYKNTQGKYANVKSIKAKYDNLLLSVGVTQKIGAKYKMYAGKKHLKKTHGQALKFFTNNTDVATVSSGGTVKAVGKGTATIYIQDIGGKYCKTKVTVE